MQTSPLITIITPTLNSDKCIEACLNSVIEQVYKNIEFLIIDGLSSDDTVKIVKSYIDKYPYIRLICEKDTGIYDAMNKGISLARGEWIYFLGSDDILSDCNVLQNVSNVLNSTNALIVYGNVRIIGNAGWASNGDVYDGYFPLSKLIQRNICHQAIFYNKFVFKGIGNYDLKYKVWSDWEFNLRAFAKYQFKYVELIIANFNGGNTSFTITDDTFLQDRWLIIYKYYKYKLYRRGCVNYLSNILESLVTKNKFSIIDVTYIKINILFNRIISVFR